MKSFKRVTATLVSLAMVVSLVACGGGAQDTASTGTNSEQASNELYGKPWVTSILQGNLPAEQPELRDDFYTHFNYEYLSEHQLKPGSAVAEHADELKEANLALIKDESKKGHDLEQMRILYNQASDFESLENQGMSELQPYLDRIDAVTSIDEL